MAGPREQLLDLHFKQQIHEFGPIFMRMACKSDQSIISYWIQIFEAAPRAQKWARNCMMLLLYGHLEEFGYLQVPFTDMRYCGRDLNEILDGYQGMAKQAPRPNQEKHGDPGIQVIHKVLSHASHTHTSHTQTSHTVARKHVAFMIQNSNQCSEPSLKRSSRHNGVPKVPKTVTFEDCRQRSLSSVLTAISVQTKFPRTSLDSLDKEANEKLIQIESRIIMELKELYQAEPPQPLSTQSENHNSRTPLRTRTLAICNTRAKTSETDDSKLKKYYEKIKENRPNNYQKQPPQPEEEGIYAVNSSNNVKFKDLEEMMAKYNNYIKLDKKLLARYTTHKSNLPKLKKIEERIAQNERIIELLKKNEMLRRECLRYYTVDGVLRPQVKQLKAEHNWSKGLLIGGYRALHRYARCRGMVRGQGKFEQLQGCKHGWRCYRRLLLANCIPYCRSRLMHTKLDGKRQLILMRMSFILRMKQVYSHLGYLEYDRKELLLLLEAFERKYLKLANELHFLLFKIVQ